MNKGGVYLTPHSQPNPTSTPHPPHISLETQGGLGRLTSNACHTAPVAARSIGPTEDISGEFWHVLVHQLTVSSNMTRFKRPVRSSVTNQVENTTKWYRKRSRLMVQYTDILMFILFLSEKWCPHTDIRSSPFSKSSLRSTFRRVTHGLNRGVS